MNQQTPLQTAAFSAQAAWQLLRLHRPSLALEMAEQLLALNPAYLSALLARTEALRQLQRLPEAAEAASKAIAQAPQADAAFYALAQVCGQQGKIQQAETANREALRLNPQSATYHGFLAQLLYLKGESIASIASANAGLRLNARHSDCLLWRALAQDQLDQPEQADEDFRQLLRLTPNSALVHTRRGKQLLWRCEPAAAAIHLTEALRLAPTESANLLPLLRRARREQHWPPWLRHHRRQGRLARGWLIVNHAHKWLAELVTPWYWVRSWWLTRHDPLFQLSPAQRRQQWLKLLLGSVLLLPLLIATGSYFDLIDADAPLSIPQIVGLLIGCTLYLMAVYSATKKTDY